MGSSWVYRPRFTLLQRTSADAAALLFAPASLDLVFIDASNGRKALSENLRLWAPKVRPGGVLAGHDYWLPHLGNLIAVHEVHAELLPEPLLSLSHTL